MSLFDFLPIVKRLRREKMQLVAQVLEHYEENKRLRATMDRVRAQLVDRMVADMPVVEEAGPIDADRARLIVDSVKWAVSMTPDDVYGARVPMPADFDIGAALSAAREKARRAQP